MNAIIVKSRFKILSTSLCMIFLSACNNASYKEDVPMADVEVSEHYESVSNNEATEDLKTTLTSSAIPANLKIIKSSNSRYKVKHVKTALNQIKNMAQKRDAYISDLRFEDNKYQKEIRFTLKVPSSNFDTMMDSIGKVAEFIDYENITTQDVTEEYMDLQTRLNTKLEVKARYEAVLRKNAKTVEDILATEDKLRIIQEEIESVQGRLKYLSNKVSYSTMQIDLYETVDYKEEPGVYNKTFWSKTKEGLTFGWHFMESIVLGIIYVWPLLIIGFLTFFFIRYRILKAKKN